MRRFGARRLALYLVGIGLATACGGTNEPEPADLPDLEVPESAVVDGLELRARLERTQANPSTRVRVSVSATNQTDQPITFTKGCNPVEPVVYQRGPYWWIPYRYYDFSPCPLVIVSVTVDPRETYTPGAPEFSVADLVGEEFRPGTYVVTARVWGVEILAGEVDAK